MDPFATLPEEMIYEICGIMETEDILNFMQTSSKYSRICSEVIRNRQKAEAEDLEQAEILTMMKDLEGDEYMISDLNLPWSPQELVQPDLLNLITVDADESKFGQIAILETTGNAGIVKQIYIKSEGMPYPPSGNWISMSEEEFEEYINQDNVIILADEREED